MMSLHGNLYNFIHILNMRRWILVLYLTVYCVCIEMLNLFSFLQKTDTIEKEIRKIFNIPGEKETRLWNKYMSNTFEPLNKPDSTIQDAGLYQGQVQWNIISFPEYISLFAHKNVAVLNDFCFFLNENHFPIDYVRDRRFCEQICWN